MLCEFKLKISENSSVIRDFLKILSQRYKRVVLRFTCFDIIANCIVQSLLNAVAKGYFDMNTGECCVASVAPPTMENELAFAPSDQVWNGLDIAGEEFYLDTWWMQIQVK